MKFHWGHAIFLVIIFFLAAMTWIIVFSFSQKVNLVTPEYYPKGVNYEDHINKVRNTTKLKNKITYKKENGKLTLLFPQEVLNDTISGSIQFYYITDFEKDQKFDIKTDSLGKQEFTTSNFISGRYILKIDWMAGKNKYYQEIDINL